MTQQDALSSFDMNQFQKPSLYLKWEAGKSVTVRVLTITPIIYNNSFEDKKTGEPIIQTKFAWTVFNFTANQAQVMQTTPNLAKKLQDLHMDVEFGSDIRKLDLRITPPAPGVIAAYDVQVLPNTREINNEQIREAMKIDLDKLFEDKGGVRINSYNPSKYGTKKAIENTFGEEVHEVTEADIDEPINLDDIPF